MKIVDAHCDALTKLWKHPQLSFAQEDELLQVSLPEMQKGNIVLQAFAVYVESTVPYGRRFHTALEMIQLFYDKVAAGAIQPILSREDLDACLAAGRRGGLLWVEGGHALEHSLTNLHTLYRLGVRGMGLTWNFRNEIADGCHEPRPGGLSLFGRKVVEEMNRLGMIIDVSHLAEPGFWDVIELSQAPVIASHSNAKRHCSHRRNLTDEQIRALIQTGGVMGLTFVPYFTNDEKRTVRIADLLHHLDHVCSLGGADHVGFGSDFDGIDETFGDLTRAGRYPLLVEELLKHYKEDEVKKFLCENWLRVFRSVLQ